MQRQILKFFVILLAIYGIVRTFPPVWFYYTKEEPVNPIVFWVTWILLAPLLGYLAYRSYKDIK